jgi:hypothetical protein
VALAQNISSDCWARLANKRKLDWENVGTLDDPEYQNSGSLNRLRGSTEVYSPISTQSKREVFMLGRIQQVMKSRGVGMFVVGAAHMQSMAEKLALLGFEIEAYVWLEPVGRVSTPSPRML